MSYGGRKHTVTLIIDTAQHWPPQPVLMPEIQSCQDRVPADLAWALIRFTLEEPTATRHLTAAHTPVRPSSSADAPLGATSSCFGDCTYRCTVSLHINLMSSLHTQEGMSLLA